MSLIRLTTFITLYLCLQGIHGQQNSVNNAPLTGQNNINQLFQGTTGLKSSSDGSVQNGSSGSLTSNLNIQSPVNLQSLLAQSPSSLATTFAIQQPQSFAQPISLQLSTVPNLQIPNIQQTANPQQSPNPQQSTNLQQLPNPQQSLNPQQPTSIPQTLNSADNLFLQQPLLSPSGSGQQPQNSYVPFNFQQASYVQSFQPQQLNFGDSNIRQQPIVTPLVQQLSTQSSQGIPITSAAFVSPQPSISTVPNCAYQYRDVVSSIGSNYLQPNVQFAYVETPQVAPSYSTLPRIAILSSPHIVPAPSNGIMAFSNPAVEVVESPLRITNDFLNEEEISCEEDNLISTLLSLLQTTDKPSPCAPSPGYSVNPYVPSYVNHGSKSSSLKTLLPLILNLLKERKDDCGCRVNCQKCDRRHKDTKDIEPQVFGGYSKKRDYTQREERVPNSRTVRGNKKLRKMKNSIPDVSDESYEHEVEDYECFSEEDVD